MVQKTIKEGPPRELLLLLQLVVYWSTSRLPLGCTEAASSLCISLDGCEAVFHTLPRVLLNPSWLDLTRKCHKIIIFFLSSPFPRSPVSGAQKHESSCARNKTGRSRRTDYRSWNLPFMVAPYKQLYVCTGTDFLLYEETSKSPPNLPRCEYGRKWFTIRDSSWKTYFQKLPVCVWIITRTQASICKDINTPSLCTHTMPCSRKSLNILLLASGSHPSSSLQQQDTTTKQLLTLEPS